MVKKRSLKTSNVPYRANANSKNLRKSKDCLKGISSFSPATVFMDFMVKSPAGKTDINPEASKINHGFWNAGIGKRPGKTPESKLNLFGAKKGSSDERKKSCMNICKEKEIG